MTFSWGNYVMVDCWLMAIKTNYFSVDVGTTFFFIQLPLESMSSVFFFFGNNKLHICRLEFNLLQFLCQNTSKNVFTWLQFMVGFFCVAATVLAG